MNLFAGFLIVRVIREDPPLDVSYNAVTENVRGIYGKVSGGGGGSGNQQLPQ